MTHDDRFKRIELMLGKEALARLRDSTVTVVGLGAVGSYAVEGLARSGVGRIRVVDFDIIVPSNINRQLYALESTLGRPKTEVARERILDINPSCNVEMVNGFLDADTAREYIGESTDLVIDAIDSLRPKVELLATARAAGILLICCLGAALRTDPTRVRIGPLDEVQSCPLGRRVRKRLRKRGVPTDFPCVYSDEPLPDPLPLALPEEPLGDRPHLARGRARHSLGSLPTLTGIFGLAAANLAIQMLVHRDDRR